MPNKTVLDTITAVAGTALAVSLCLSPVANAADTPFNMTDLPHKGYLLAEPAVPTDRTEGEADPTSDRIFQAVPIERPEKEGAQMPLVELNKPPTPESNTPESIKIVPESIGKDKN